MGLVGQSDHSLTPAQPPAPGASSCSSAAHSLSASVYDFLRVAGAAWSQFLKGERPVSPFTAPPPPGPVHSRRDQPSKPKTHGRGLTRVRVHPQRDKGAEYLKVGLLELSRQLREPLIELQVPEYKGESLSPLPSATQTKVPVKSQTCPASFSRMKNRGTSQSKETYVRNSSLSSRLNHKVLLKGSQDVLGDVPNFGLAFKAPQPNPEASLLEAGSWRGPAGWQDPVFIKDVVSSLSNAGDGVAQWLSNASVHHSHPPRAGYHVEHRVTPSEFLTQ